MIQFVSNKEIFPEKNEIDNDKNKELEQEAMEVVEAVEVIEESKEQFSSNLSNK